RELQFKACPAFHDLVAGQHAAGSSSFIEDPIPRLKIAHGLPSTGRRDRRVDRQGLAASRRAAVERLAVGEKQEGRLLWKGGVRDVFRHPWLDGRLQALRNLWVG